MWVKNKSELEGALKKIRLDLSNVLDHSKHGAIVEIKKHRPNRSQAQHNFYMVIVTSISKFYMEAGALYIIKGFKLEYDKNFVHELCKKMLPVNPDNGLQYKSTKKLSIKQFIYYIDKINQFWQEDSVYSWTPPECRSYFEKNGYRLNEEGKVIEIQGKKNTNR
tara:strand:+ start:1818 stop:2309 length:492 start_codon:yes stop_codon:yes gene_type:complete